MKSHYPAPSVTGVTDGILDLVETDLPIIEVNYPTLDKAHSVSVMWEIYGKEQHWIYCCELQQQSPGEDSHFQRTPRHYYSNTLSRMGLIKVWYSVSIENGPSVDSEPLEFEATSAGSGPPPIGSVGSIAVRETIKQHEGLYPTIVNVEVRTSALGEGAHIFAKWENMTAQPARVTWSNSTSEVLWELAPLTSDSRLAEFLLPISEINKCDGSHGYLTLHNSLGSAVYSIRLCVNTSCDPDPTKP